MKKRTFLTTVLFGPALLAAAPRAALAVDPSYLGLLRDGIHSYDSGDFPEAVQRLRLACFGMLEEPEPLIDCLARLALAQDKAGDPDAFRDTFRRVVEAEERFGSYTKAPLPPELRTAFEQKAAALIAAPVLSSVPAFKNLVARKGQAQTVAQSPGKKPAPPAPPAAAGSGTGTTAAPPTASPPASPPTGSPAPSAGTGPAAAPPPAPTIPNADREKMTQARRLLTSEGKLNELRQAFQLAREAADANPASTEAQHLAAESAYRISRWGDAATYFRRGGEPAASQPELLFYMAVALYESGDAPAAQTVLRRSLPNLQRTPYVDTYARKILGGAGAP